MLTGLHDLSAFGAEVRAGRVVEVEVFRPPLERGALVEQRDLAQLRFRQLAQHAVLRGDTVRCPVLPGR